MPFSCFASLKGTRGVSFKQQSDNLAAMKKGALLYFFNMPENV